MVYGYFPCAREGNKILVFNTTKTSLLGLAARHWFPKRLDVSTASTQLSGSEHTVTSDAMAKSPVSMPAIAAPTGVGGGAQEALQRALLPRYVSKLEGS